MIKEIIAYLERRDAKREAKEQEARAAKELARELEEARNPCFYGHLFCNWELKECGGYVYPLRQWRHCVRCKFIEETSTTQI